MTTHLGRLLHARLSDFELLRIHLVKEHSLAASGAFKLVLEPARASILLITSVCIPLTVSLNFTDIDYDIEPVSHHYLLSHSCSTTSTLRRISGTTN
jgi:hypothetical protein